MIVEISVSLAVAILVVLPIFLQIRKKRRRETWLQNPLPALWEAAIDKDFPRYRSLPSEVQEKLPGIAQVLAGEKNFEACGSLTEVTEEMKALISIQAALLIVQIPKHRFYPKLRSILVYPGAFRDRGKRQFDLPAEDRSTLLGQSWQTGSVILSWDDVVDGARNAHDGLNVVFHEFAHQLDQANGAADGVPILKSREAYGKWSEVFERNYEELVTEVNSRYGRQPLLDPYGATNPAEFFAVSTETFFEESQDLLKEHPDLYEQLREFYHLDPAKWT